MWFLFLNFQNALNLNFHAKAQIQHHKYNKWLLNCWENQFISFCLLVFENPNNISALNETNRARLRSLYRTCTGCLLQDRYLRFLLLTLLIFVWYIKTKQRCSFTFPTMQKPGITPSLASSAAYWMAFLKLPMCCICSAGSSLCVDKTLDAKNLVFVRKKWVRLAALGTL